jgi:hypothetical protein
MVAFKFLRSMLAILFCNLTAHYHQKPFPISQMMYLVLICCRYYFFSVNFLRLVFVIP